MLSMKVKLNPVRHSVDPTVVRYADPEDFTAIMMLCRQLAKENALFEMDETIVQDAIRRAIARDGGVLGVIGNIGEIEGMMLLRAAQFWYTKQAHLEELFSFVPPKYRKSENAKKLVAWGKSMADMLNVPFFVGVTSTYRTEAKVRLYRRMLGTWLGCFYIYRGQHHPNPSDTEH